VVRRPRWRPPTRGQGLFLLAVTLVAVLGAVLAVRLAAPPAPSVAPPSTTASSTEPSNPATATPRSGLATIAPADLPPEARDTIALIDRGGPYPYRQDGTVFSNVEGRLPARPTGYYHEFTVRTPGLPDRGPRRLVLGANGDLYYTDDHYDSFRQVIR
jgi:ribonuclease T1